MNMIYSYTQISQYLRCPRSYRYRYLDGWREKDTRAPWSLAAALKRLWRAYFLAKDWTAALFKEWGAFRDTPFEYRKGESWDRLLHQGVSSAREVRAGRPGRGPAPQEEPAAEDSPKPLRGDNEFVSYIDAIGELDGKRSA